MDEIYTIWVGEYSDAEVIGVAYDKEIADAYAKLHNGYVETAPIITDKTFITKANNMIVCHAYRYWNGTIEFISTTYYEEKPSETEQIKDTSGAYIIIYVYGVEDKAKSRKIAKDKVMKYLAEKMENDMLEGNDEV